MSIFSDITDVQELIDLRVVVRDAWLRGLMSVNYNGEMLSWSTPDNMRKTIAELTQEINRRNGVKAPAGIIYTTTPSRGI